jgi:hypothetical protein
MEEKHRYLKRCEEESEEIKYFLDEIKIEKPGIDLGEAYSALNNLDAALYNLGIMLNEPDNPPTITF